MPPNYLRHPVRANHSSADSVPMPPLQFLGVLAARAGTG